MVDLMIVTPVMVVVPIPMIMGVGMAVIVIQPLSRARIIGKHQRFDRYRYRPRRQSNLTQIDIVEIPKYHPVDHQHVNRHLQFVFEEMP